MSAITDRESSSPRSESRIPASTLWPISLCRATNTHRSRPSPFLSYKNHTYKSALEYNFLYNPYCTYSLEKRYLKIIYTRCAAGTFTSHRKQETLTHKLQSQNVLLPLLVWPYFLQMNPNLQRQVRLGNSLWLFCVTKYNRYCITITLK